MSGDQIFTSQPHGSHLLSLFLLPTGITSYTSHVLQPLTEWSPFLYSSGSVCILTFSIHPCLNCSNILAHVPVPIFIHTEPEYLLKCKFCLVLPLPEIFNDSPGHARKKKKGHTVFSQSRSSFLATLLLPWTLPSHNHTNCHIFPWVYQVDPCFSTLLSCLLAFHISPVGF